MTSLQIIICKEGMQTFDKYQQLFTVLASIVK